MIAEYLEERSHELVSGKDVLELGAGAGLPSLLCAAKGARTVRRPATIFGERTVADSQQVVLTDYPDEALLVNLRHNVTNCGLSLETNKIHVEVGTSTPARCNI